MTSDFLGPVTEIFVFAVILVSWTPRIISMSFPFPWSQLKLGSSHLWLRLCSRSFPIIVHLPDSNRDTHLFHHHYEWNLLFFNENRVCSPPNTVHQHPGRECPKCEWVFAQSSLTDFWATLTIYTACARPILSFPWSWTEKYCLRKTSPRIQVSVDILTVSSFKVVEQWPLESWGIRNTHQSPWALTCNSRQYSDPAQFLVLFPSFGNYQGVLWAAGDVRVHPKPKRDKTRGCHEERCQVGED